MRKKLLVVCLLALVVVMGLPAVASAPPIIVATAGGFVSPVVVAAPGDTLQVRGDVLPHTFSTGPTVKLCAGSGGPTNCTAGVAPLGTTTVTFATGIADGAYQFFCAIHPWMTGFVVIN